MVARRFLTLEVNSDVNIPKRTNTNNIISEVKRRLWRCLGRPPTVDFIRSHYNGLHAEQDTDDSAHGEGPRKMKGSCRGRTGMSSVCLLDTNNIFPPVAVNSVKLVGHNV